MGDAERENDDKKNIRFAPRRDDPDPSSPLYVQVPSLVLGPVLKKKITAFCRRQKFRPHHKDGQANIDRRFLFVSLTC